MNPEVYNGDLPRPGQLATIPPAPRRGCNDDDIMPSPICDPATALARLAELKRFIHEVMVLDVDYGKIPGTPKETLYKSGAEKLLEVYGYSYEANVVERVEDWTGKMFGGGQPFFHYEVAVDVYSKRSGALVGRGIGSCNSREARYRWRDARRSCPACGSETIIKGKDTYGGGWLCFAKKGGCGAKYKNDDPAIVDQALGRVENDDVATLCNTILKMAKKRAVVDAALGVTRSSAMFVPEEDVEVDDDPGGAPAGQRGTQRRAAGKGADKANGAGAPVPEGRVAVSFRGQTLHTKGILAGTLLRVRALRDTLDRVHDGASSALLENHFNVTTDVDLTDEQGRQFVQILESADPKGATGAASGDAGY